MDVYFPNIRSKDEFLQRFYILYTLLDKKVLKTTAEKALLKRLNLVKEYIEKGTVLPSDKNSYNNMLPYFELGGGWGMMKSDIGKEATDLLYYFVQNF